MPKKFIIFLASLCLICNIAFAHPGRTDSNGGHWNRSTGTYHYHNGSSSSSGGSSYSYSKSTPLPWQGLWSELSKSAKTMNVAPTAAPAKSSSLSFDRIVDFVKDIGWLWILLSVIPCFYLYVWFKKIVEGLKEKHRAKLEKKEEDMRRRAEYERQIKEKERLMQEEKERKHAEWLKRREEAERKAAEYQAIVDERRKQQELEYEERKRKREEQKQNEIAMFQTHSIKELSGMPEFAEIGSDGLPKVKDEDGWGEYFTRYYYSPKSRSYHKKTCRYAKTPYHVFACDWHIKACHACSICNPEPKPSDSWFKEYKKLKTKCIRYGIKPIPDD